MCEPRLAQVFICPLADPRTRACHKRRSNTAVLATDHFLDSFRHPHAQHGDPLGNFRSQFVWLRNRRHFGCSEKETIGTNTIEIGMKREIVVTRANRTRRNTQSHETCQSAANGR